MEFWPLCLWPCLQLRHGSCKRSTSARPKTRLSGRLRPRIQGFPRTQVVRVADGISDSKGSGHRNRESFLQPHGRPRNCKPKLQLRSSHCPIAAVNSWMHHLRTAQTGHHAFVHSFMHSFILSFKFILFRFISCHVTRVMSCHSLSLSLSVFSLYFSLFLSLSLSLSLSPSLSLSLSLSLSVFFYSLSLSLSLVFVLCFLFLSLSLSLSVSFSLYISLHDMTTCISKQEITMFYLYLFTLMGPYTGHVVVFFPSVF